MTNEEADAILERSDPVTRLGHTPPPQWYGWTIKLGLAYVAVGVTTVLILFLIYVGPTLKNLSERTAFEKKQDACYDRHTANVTDGNAGVVVGMGSLVVLLAVPTDQRDKAGIEQAVQRIDQSSRLYVSAIQQRNDWVENGRPLPCPVT